MEHHIEIRSTCGQSSPRLLDYPEIRFSCQKEAGHRGQHRAVFAWDSAHPVEDRRPWKGAPEPDGEEVAA